METSPKVRGTIRGRSCTGLGSPTFSAPRRRLFLKRRAHRVTTEQAHSNILTTEGTAGLVATGGSTQLQKGHSDEAALKGNQEAQPTSPHPKQSLVLEPELKYSSGSMGKELWGGAR